MTSAKRNYDVTMKLTGLGDDVRDAAVAVLAVVKVDLGLARSLHGQGKSPGAGLARADAELGGDADQGGLEAGTGGGDAVRPALHERSDGEEEGGAGDVLVEVLDRNVVDAHFLKKILSLVSKC